MCVSNIALIDTCAQQIIACTEREYIEGIFEEGKEAHVQWASAFIGALKELLAYVKKWHPENMAWGNKVGGWHCGMRTDASTPTAPITLRSLHLSDPIVGLVVTLSSKRHSCMCAHAVQMRSMTFWSNALAQTAPGDSEFLPSPLSITPSRTRSDVTEY